MRSRRPPTDDSLSVDRDAGSGPGSAARADRPVVSNQQVLRHLGASPPVVPGLFTGAGNHAVGGWLQPKLEVGGSDSPLEREADRVAGSMVDGGAVAVGPAGPPPGSAGPAPAAVGRALAGSGQPLDDDVRGRFESRLGHGFADVRVHPDSPAPAAIGARAFTVGTDVVFAPGRYAPETGQGQRLLAHELTHVVQQRGAGIGPVQRSGEDAPPPAPTGGVPVLFGFDQAARRVYASVTVPGHTVSEISTYVYGTPDKVVELQQANGVRDTVPPGRNLTLVAGAFAPEAQRVVNQALSDGTILRTTGVPPGETGTGPIMVYRFAAGGQQFELTEGQLRGMAQGQAAWVSRKATRLRDYAEIGRQVHREHLDETNSAVRWISDWLADQDELPLSVWDDALARSGRIVDALASFDAGSGPVTAAVELVSAQANQLPDAADALDTAQRAWHRYIEGTIGGAEVAVHRLEIVRDTSFIVAAGLAGAAAAPVVFAAAGTGLATVGVTGTTATVLAGTAAVGTGAVAGGTVNTALNVVAPSSTDHRPIDEQIVGNFRRGALAGGLGAVGGLAAPGVSGAVSQRLYGVAPEALTGFGARATVGTLTGVGLGVPLGGAGAGIENLPALLNGTITTEEYLRRVGWGAVAGGISGAITGFLGAAFTRPAGGGLTTRPPVSEGPVEPDVIFQPPQVDPRTGAVSQLAYHRPTGQVLRATYDPATGTGQIVNLSTGQQVAVVSNGVVSPPARALLPAGGAAEGPGGGVSEAPAAGSGPVATVVPPAPRLGSGVPLLGPGEPAVPTVAGPTPVAPVPAPADAAAIEQANRAAARLNTTLTANGLTGDELFNGLDPQSAGKVSTALSDWPRAIPPTLRTRLVGWARDGCGGNAREFANRVEFARARYRELYEQSLRDLAATTPPGQLVVAARRATVTALDTEAGMEGMSATLASDLAIIAAAPRSGVLPPGLAPGDVPAAVRALPAVPWESGTAEAYHARKHQTELPVEEQNPGSPVPAFAESLRETLRSGTIVRDQPAGTSRQLIFHRVESPTLTLEAIVYVRADGSVVVATYGKAKAR